MSHAGMHTRDGPNNGSSFKESLLRGATHVWFEQAPDMPALLGNDARFVSEGATLR